MPRKNPRPAARHRREALRAKMEGKAKQKPRPVVLVDHSRGGLAAAMLAAGLVAVNKRD